MSTPAGTPAWFITAAATSAVQLATVMTTQLAFVRYDQSTDRFEPLAVIGAYLTTPKLKSPAPNEALLLLVPLDAGAVIGDRLDYDGWTWQINDRTTYLALGQPVALELLASRVVPTSGSLSGAPAGSSGGGAGFTLNATVTTRANGVVKLNGVDALIGDPDARALADFGGIVKHVVKVAPQSDVHNIRPGDQLFIESWGANAVDPAKPYYIIQENPDGPIGREFHRLVISEKQQR